MPLVYTELHQLAHRHIKKDRPGHTLQTSALVNEAFLRLVDQRDVQWQSRAHFFGIAAQVMRRLLVDHARRAFAGRRDKGLAITLSDEVPSADDAAMDALGVHEALEKLAVLDPRQADVVELRYFGGLKIEEIAEAISMSPATVKRELTTATVWLRHRMKGEKT